MIVAAAIDAALMSGCPDWETPALCLLIAPLPRRVAVAAFGSFDIEVLAPAMLGLVAGVDATLGGKTGLWASRAGPGGLLMLPAISNDLFAVGSETFPPWRKPPRSSRECLLSVIGEALSRALISERALACLVSVAVRGRKFWLTSPYLGWLP